MIAVILFFVVIIVFAIVFGVWGNSLDKREKELKSYEKDLDYLQRSYSVNIAELHAKQESLRKQESKIQSEKQDIADQLNALLAKHQELNTREAEIEAKERRLGFILTPAPDVIEPVEEPQKVAFGTAEKKRCPRCGKEMKMLTDYVRTTEPPQFQYVCPECGYEEVDTCPPTHNLVGTDKKPVKKARKGGKK